MRQLDDVLGDPFVEQELAAVVGEVVAVVVDQVVAGVGPLPLVCGQVLLEFVLGLGGLAHVDRLDRIAEWG